MLKNKQISSKNQLYGEALIADGSGKTIYNFPQIQKGTVFPLNPVSGDTFYYLTDNLVYHFDGLRSKWLSIATKTFQFGRNNLAANTAGYLGFADFFHSSTNGILMPKNGTIIKASLLNNNTITRSVQIRINNSATIMVDISLTAQNTRIINNANLNFNSGDFMNVYVATSAGNVINGTNCLVEVAWRV
jgi:hypothetical protein